jgi:hypothetical protein
MAANTRFEIDNIQKLLISSSNCVHKSSFIAEPTPGYTYIVVWEINTMKLRYVPEFDVKNLLLSFWAESLPSCHLHYS